MGLWLAMAHYGSLWLTMAHYGSLWLSMALYGSMGSLWLAMALYRSLCISVAPYGSLWLAMALYDANCGTNLFQAKSEREAKKKELAERVAEKSAERGLCLPFPRSPSPDRCMY